jgi:hypothetical protein
VASRKREHALLAYWQLVSESTLRKLTLLLCLLQQQPASSAKMQ